MARHEVKVTMTFDDAIPSKVRAVRQQIPIPGGTLDVRAGDLVAAFKATTTPPPPPPPTPTPSSGRRVAWRGKESFWLGANLPWFNWARDFGGGAADGVRSPATKAAVTQAFHAAASAGVRNVRWWLFPGDPWQITRGAAGGTPAGLNAAVHADIDAAVALAKAHGLTLHFCLFSGIEHVPAAWRQDQAQRQALSVILAGIAARYKAEPVVASWEIVNEPEWKVWNDPVVGQAEAVAFVAAVATALSAATPAHVHVGSAYLDGMKMWAGVPGIDLYSPHWYAGSMAGGDWDASGYADIAAVRAKFGITDKRPIIIGEAVLSADANPAATLEKLYGIGYAGVWGWSLLPARTQDKIPVALAQIAAWAKTKTDIGPVYAPATTPPDPGGGGTTDPDPGGGNEEEPDAPAPPSDLSAMWHAGMGVMLGWTPIPMTTVSVYRGDAAGGDMTLVKAGLTGSAYTDATVQQAAATRTLWYAVAAVKDGAEGVAGDPVSIAIPAKEVTPGPVEPLPPVAGVVNIVRQVPDHDSVVIVGQQVVGARDYRMFRLDKPLSVKYAGTSNGHHANGKFFIEWNGKDEAGEYVVEATDAQGPFMPMTHPDPTRLIVKNGHGPATANPKALARSKPFKLTFHAREFAGDAALGNQAFIDHFTAPFPLTQKGDGATHLEFRDAAGNWLIFGHNIDFKRSVVMAMSDHIMDDTTDGGTIGSNQPTNQANANMVFALQKTFDLSKGGVFHFTFQEDMFFPRVNRRFGSTLIYEAGSRIVVPENMEMTASTGGPDWGAIKPTEPNGNSILLRHTPEFHQAYAMQFAPGGRKQLRPIVSMEFPGDRWGPAQRDGHDGLKGIDVAYTPGKWLNGTEANLDLRHQIDGYLITPAAGGGPNGHLIVTETDEEKIRVKTVDKPLPVPLQALFPSMKVQVAFLHGVYHLAVEREELEKSGGLASHEFTVLRSPLHDNRHWDAMGARVIARMPF